MQFMNTHLMIYAVDVHVQHSCHYLTLRCNILRHVLARKILFVPFRSLFYNFLVLSHYPLLFLCNLKRYCTTTLFWPLLYDLEFE